MSSSPLVLYCFNSGCVRLLAIASIFIRGKSSNIIGVFLHYGSDAQKYFTLKYRKGLITEGFFSRCRNPNYLGEIFNLSRFCPVSPTLAAFSDFGWIHRRCLHPQYA